jgi:hypothetical protein
VVIDGAAFRQRLLRADVAQRAEQLAKLAPVFVGLQPSLLHDVGCVQFCLQTALEVQPRQEA